MQQCKTCGGTYAPVLVDGTRYFHACPPLSVSELKDGLASRRLVLTKADADRLNAAKDADHRNPPAKDAISQEDLVLASLVIERPDRRDENVTGQRDERNRPIIKAEGKGSALVP